MKAKKHLGQHFLKNEHYAQKIAEHVISSNHSNHLLEIGPGMGFLSKYFIGQVEHLKLLELDDDMVEFLNANFDLLNPDQIIHADVLKHPFEEVFDGNEFTLVGNFPYNISSQIVFKILKNRNLIPLATGMFQKEVAQRIASNHGTKDYGILSVLTQVFYEVRILFHIGPGNFNPPPKVDSSVISFLRRDKALITEREDQFFAFVKLAFQQRRKMLRNSIKSLITDANRDRIDAYLSLRPEQMSVEDFVSLAELIRN